MKSYLCIGGPKHGQAVTIPDNSRDLRVATYGSSYIGSYENAEPMTGIRQEVYVRRELGIGEEVSETTHNGVTARVRVQCTVTILQHESILTVQEAMAYYRKFRETDIHDAILFATRRLELGRKK